MAEEPTGWRSLSSSSREAFRWAIAAASLRTRAREPTVGATDVLVGLVLAHSDGDRAKELLDRYEIPLGSVVGADLRRTLAADALDAARLEAPTAPPAMDDDVQAILAEAERLTAVANEKVASLRVVLGGILRTPNAAADVLRDLLGARGVSLADLASSYPRFLSTDGSYRHFLEENHPLPPPVQLPEYRTDQPAARASRRPSATGGQTDLLDTGPAVEAFTYLICSRSLAPPLAIGLFGDWGSGKSFFMRSVQRRIDELTSDSRTRSRPQRELPYFKNVAQVEFNAWHYVEGDLWASLVEHIFRNLRVGGEVDSMVVQRRKALLAELQDALGKREEVKSERDELVAQRTEREKELVRAKEARDEKLKALLERQADPLAGKLVKAEVSDEVKKALRSADPRLVVTADDARELVDAIASARRTVERAGRLGAVLRLRRWQWILALVLLVTVVPAIAAVVEWIGASSVTSAIAAVGPVLAGAAALLRGGAKAADSAMDEIERAERLLDAEVAAARADAQVEVENLRSELVAAEEAVRRNEAAQRELSDRIGRLERGVAEMTAGKVLSDFILDRVGSDDYRQRLGVAALIRRDFEQLSEAVAEGNDDFVRTDEGTSGPATEKEAINRIVLYIDDLDRCPTETVVKVLQAVHLLLAFPLFVVVVAVDSRWLAHALSKHYGALAESTSSRATPADYLEKIFQVPYMVQPLDATQRTNVALGLLKRSGVTGDGSSSGAADEQRARAGGADSGSRAPLVRLMMEEPAPTPQRATEALTLRRGELEFLARLGPLLGTTPRSVKRFVNLYQLLRALVAGHPLRAGSSDVPVTSVIALLLAINSGSPSLGERLLRRLEENPDETLLAAAQTVAEDDARWRERPVVGWLTAHPELGQLRGRDVEGCVTEVRRFSFRLGA